MLEIGMKCVESAWQTDVCCSSARSRRSVLFRERHISVGLGGGGYYFISELQCSGNSMQLLGVKFLHDKLLKFLSFHENEECSRHSQIQDKASLLNVSRQGLILAMEGQICRKQLCQLLLDYYARKTFVLLYK